MGFCPQLGGVGPCPAQCIWQGSGFAADQTNAMLAVVRADDESLVPPQAAGLALSVARPLPTETASLGFGGSPAVGGDKTLPFCIFSAPLCGGGITTLGVRFMPLKRWTPAGHGGVFAVFMLPRNSPCAGKISPRRVHTPPQPLTAHTAAYRAKHGAFSPPETPTGSIGSTAWVPCASSLSARRSSISRLP